MRVPRFQPRELVEVRTGVVDAGSSVITDLSKRVENVREVARGKLGDARPLAAHTPGCEVADDAWQGRTGCRRWHRRRGITGNSGCGKARQQPDGSFSSVLPPDQGARRALCHYRWALQPLHRHSNERNHPFGCPLALAITVGAEANAPSPNPIAAVQPSCSAAPAMRAPI